MQLGSNVSPTAFIGSIPICLIRRQAVFINKIPSLSFSISAALQMASITGRMASITSATAIVYMSDFPFACAFCNYHIQPAREGTYHLISQARQAGCRLLPEGRCLPEVIGFFLTVALSPRSRPFCFWQCFLYCRHYFAFGFRCLFLCLRNRRRFFLVFKSGSLALSISFILGNLSFRYIKSHFHW